MKNILSTIKKVALGVACSVALFGVAYTVVDAATTFKVVQTPSISLYSGISGAATSMRITPYPRDLDGTKLTITDFGSTPTLTVDPKVKNIEEIISFTAITDNGDNTATLTGLSRNLTSKYPYTTPGTGRTHGAGATVVFGNNPQVYGRLAAKENDEAITGLWTVPDPITGQGVASKNYVDGKTLYGIGNASEVATGTVEIATAAEAAAGTTNGSLGRLAIPSSLTNATCATGGIIPVTDGTSKKINAQCISTSTPNSLYPYVLPAANPAASSSVLMSDTSGNVIWGGVSTLLNASSTISNPDIGTASTTIYSVTVPARSLGTNNVIRVTMYGVGLVGNTANQMFVEAAYGSAATTSMTLNNATGGSISLTGALTLYIKASATNAQRITLGYQGNTTGISATTGGASVVSSAAITTDSTADQTILIRIRQTQTGALLFTNLNNAVVTELMRL